MEALAFRICLWPERLTLGRYPIAFLVPRQDSIVPRRTIGPLSYVYNEAAAQPRTPHLKYLATSAE